MITGVGLGCDSETLKKKGKVEAGMSWVGLCGPSPFVLEPVKNNDCSLEVSSTGTLDLQIESEVSEAVTVSSPLLARSYKEVLLSLVKEVFQHRKKKKTRRKMSNRALMRGGDDRNTRYESYDHNWDARRNLGGGGSRGW
jgi:hypothetical protein